MMWRYTAGREAGPAAGRFVGWSFAGYIPLPLFFSYIVSRSMQRDLFTSSSITGKLNLINNLALKFPRELVSGFLGMKPFATNHNIRMKSD
jgi:hypothetical protein